MARITLSIIFFVVTVTILLMLMTLLTMLGIPVVGNGDSVLPGLIFLMMMVVIAIWSIKISGRLVRRARTLKDLSR
jgi:hypothetical protein